METKANTSKGWRMVDRWRIKEMLNIDIRYYIIRYYFSISILWQKRWHSKSVTWFMAMSYIKYPLMISLENAKINPI